MHAVATTLVLLVGLVNLLPVSGALSKGRLESLYGIAIEDTNLEVLMRHRALLFGIVGGLLVASAYHLPLRLVGLTVGLISMLSFVVVAWVVGDYNAQLRRVVIIDLVASAALFASFVIERMA